MKTYPSIFNDCLSPVSPGPSSSNTAGPYRLGSMAVDLLEGKPSHLYIEMAKEGGYFATFYGMHSDKAFLAGILKNAGVFEGKNRQHFTAKLWDRLCPENTNRGDLLHFVRQLTDHAPLRLCLYGFLSGFLYGWIMNLYFIIGYVSPITWQTVGAAYLSSFFFDFCHGLCTFLVLWALGDPWVRKLERIKIKFGLTAEERNYVLPPSTFEIARENYE